MPWCRGASSFLEITGASAWRDSLASSRASVGAGTRASEGHWRLCLLFIFFCRRQLKQAGMTVADVLLLDYISSCRDSVLVVSGAAYSSSQGLGSRCPAKTIMINIGGPVQWLESKHLTSCRICHGNAAECFCTKGSETLLLSVITAACHATYIIRSHQGFESRRPLGSSAADNNSSA